MRLFLITELYPVDENDYSTTHALRNFVDAWGEGTTVFRPLQLSIKHINKLRAYFRLIFGPARYIDNKRIIFFLLVKFPFFRKYLYWIKNKHDLKPPDVILGHSLMGNYVAHSMSEQYGVPFSAGIHNYDIQNLENEKAQYEKIFQKSSLIACRSQAIKEHFNRITGKRFNDLIFIANSGIDKELIEDHSFFMRKAEEFSGHKCRYITAARLLPLKNIDVNISVLSELSQDYSYNIIGDGSERGRLQGQINSQGLSDKMRIHGWKSLVEVLSYLKESDIFILASAPETFGLAYLEAMAKGCIIIGAYGWGIDGIIRHGENGFLVQPGDPESLKVVLKQIMELSVEKRQEIASAARETVLDLTSQRVAEAYFSKVKEMVQR